jgi:hypothetical protein
MIQRAAGHSYLRNNFFVHHNNYFNSFEIYRDKKEQVRLKPLFIEVRGSTPLDQKVKV